jgi:hypothetical protein
VAVYTSSEFKNLLSRLNIESTFKKLFRDLVDSVSAITEVTTAGVVEASKAVVVSADKDIGDFRNLDAVNIDAGSSGAVGSIDIFPSTASKGKVTIACADQDGNTTVSATVLGMGQATAINVPDPGVATAYVMLSNSANDRSAVTATNAELSILSGVTATKDEINMAADRNIRTQTLTVTGPITEFVQSIELDHTTVAIAATIASAYYRGLLVIKSITEPGAGQDHTVTIAAGTFNGTNKIATFADINDTLVVYFDSAGNGTILANIGSVTLSG